MKKKKDVLIISSQETFIIKGLAMKLQEVGIETDFSTTSIKEIKEKLNGIKYFIMYTDETIEEIRDVLVFLNDICTEREKHVILVGTRRESEIAIQYFSKDNVSEWFERPLDMNLFLKKMTKYIEDASDEAMKKSILIVDDDVAYMRMIADWLKPGYRVGMANSGVQAITWLAKNKADLILLDYEMPVTSGPKVLEMLKTEASTSSIPVMFLTGKHDRKSIEQVMALKPVDYLLKSIDRWTLLKKLATFFLEQRKSKM